jgi:hypothetical protein
MKKVKNKLIKLRNRYNNEMVFTRDYHDIVTENDIKFIRVFDEKNPQRTFLVNRDSFTIVDK